MQISVIIPVYKSGRYLKKCVESVVSQSVSEMEVILVDDGSPDECPLLCDELASIYSCVKVIHKVNGGCFTARREGFCCSTGDWITFVDSDDMLPPDALNRMLSASSDETDIVVGYSFESSFEPHFVPIEEWRSKLIESSPILCTPWGKLFRRSIMSEKVFTMMTSLRAASDMPMNIRIAYSTQKPVFLVPFKVYSYNSHDDSLSRSAAWTSTKSENLFTEVVAAIPEYDRINQEPSLVENKLRMLRRIIIERRNYSDNPYEASKYVLDLREMVDRKVLSFADKLAVFKTDYRITFIYYKLRLKVQIAKEFMASKFGLSMTN